MVKRTPPAFTIAALAGGIGLVGVAAGRLSNLTWSGSNPTAVAVMFSVLACIGGAMVTVAMRVSRRAQKDLAEREAERQAAQRHREAAIRQGGAPGQLTEAAPAPGSGGLSLEKEAGALALADSRRKNPH